MTTRLYYTDAETLGFEARVVEALTLDGRPAVVLDRTLFYPTSGGQPFDTGTLGPARVVDVVDDDARILHVLDTPVAAGTVCVAMVDAPRRRDHRQQHTGQHVLSAAFDRLFANRTVGFHMGTDLSTIDLAAPMSSDQVEQAVDEANRVVWEDRPVTVRFVDAAEAASLGLRKESVRTGELRLVEVPGFDLSACGGTHVARTGEIGVIAVTGTEKFKGRLRVSFACGGRAVRVFRELRDCVAGCVRALSVLPGELPAAVQKVQADGKALRKQIAELQVARAGHEAERLVHGAETIEGGVLIAAVLEGWDAQGLKAVASAVLSKGPATVVLVGGTPPCALVVGQSRPGAAGAGDLVRAITARLGGRGGGTPELAQAGGVTAEPAEVLRAARESMVTAPSA